MTIIRNAIIICLFFISCKGVKKTHSKETILDSLQKETLIPYSEDSSINKGDNQTYLQNFGKLIGLPLLPNQDEELRIRIWIWDMEEKYVVDIARQPRSTNCFITKFSSKKVNNKDYIVIINNLKNLQPISNWNNFFNVVNKFKILTKKGGKPYEKQEHVLTTMSYIQFEIFEHGRYRFYEYLEPSFYRYVDTESRDIYEFLKYINYEMNVSVYSPAEKLFVEPT